MVFGKRFLVFGCFLIVIFLGRLGYQKIIQLEENNARLHSLIESIKSTKPTKEVVEIERVAVGTEPWRDLQSKVKNTVVQVFSQVAAVDLIQPFKTPNQYQGTGSGFFINNNGAIELITNAHVVDQSRAVWIQIPSLGKEQIDVDVVGVSPERDLALLRVRPEGLTTIQKILGDIPYLTLGDSEMVQRGDQIMALGYPLGQQGLKSTTGVVSGRESHLLQISAPINPGSSGGPLLNMKGEIIGINTLYCPDAQNVGYVIPINELKVVLDDLHKVKLLRKPFLGVLFNNASESLTTYLNNPHPGGLYVVDVYHNSPLERVGVKRGDMIYEINNHKIDVYGELLWNEDKISIVDYVSQLKLGQEIRLVVYRLGRRHDLKLTFEQTNLLPIRKIYPGYEPIDYEVIAGMCVQPLTINHLPALVNASPSLAKYTEMKHQTEPALIVTHIFYDSQAHRCRSILPGSILKDINGQRVKTLKELRSALNKSVTTGNLTIETTEGVFVVCPFKKVIDEDVKLAQDYYFPLSKTIKALVAQMSPTEPNKSVALAMNEKQNATA